MIIYARASLWYNEMGFKNMPKLPQKFTNLVNIRKILVFNAVLLLAIKVALPLAGPQLATIWEQITPFDPQEIIAETNKVRTANNLSPLKANFKLDAAASEKLSDMIAKGYFAHNNPEGLAPWFWIEKNNYEYTHAGENLALGFLRADETVAAWMNSSSHRANIMNTNYNEIGVATGKAVINGVTGVLVVQMFGKSNIRQIAIQPSPTITQQPTSLPAEVIPAELPELLAGAANDNLSEIKTSVSAPKQDTVKLQHVSTDTNILAVSEPTELSIVLDLPSKLNTAYQGYIALFIVFLAVIILLNGLSKKVVLATAINLSLILISIVVPSATVTMINLIL
ncbi:MAG: hypothetical protein A3J47_02455 [Candidatus Yanofskybacteria bacterium RIFCSPHIGHO2_02_FULL_43_22]|uniref:SCP domain-containing protein n=1 Tax=Candidatus Yanofskybacteria bacterium RIFCSPHIGHO2_02_FULL_43_22 TaxID=1802681 RepID=A0A1F8FKS6_9BACT|nr:MAG: hypothetical protein A3J47_02455 [Candidatus Yanofskybacteria bacterium RIFCSPHIGHO2_02_FULL_43_22]